jgi:hypothetical protein
LEEFLAHLDPAEGFQVALARCLPYGQTLTYWPLRGLLGEEIGKPQVVDAFVQGGHATADAARLADLVLTTLGVEQEEVTDRESIFASWRLLIEAIARQAPHVATGLDQTIREQIVERSGGNPFFALELVRGLAEKNTTADMLPDTVHAAVLARLDLLSSQERALAQAASVAGRVFHVAALQAVLEDLTPSEIDRALDGLTRRHLIVQASGEAFTFLHVLIRDVAYGTLTRFERVRIHSKIAEWLEEFAAEKLDEFTELIAYHYQEAVRLSQQSAVPIKLPIDLARVVHSLERASLLASHSGALAEARAYLHSAIELAAEGEYLRLYERLGDALLQGDSAVDAYRKAIAYWHSTADQDPLVGARLLRKLLVACTRWHPWDVQDWCRSRRA